MDMKLSPSQKELIVAEIQAKTATMKQLAARYRISQPLISRVFKKMTDRALRPRKVKGNQETNLTPPDATQAIPLKDVLEAVAELYQENPQDPFILEVNLKDHIVSIRW